MRSTIIFRPAFLLTLSFIFSIVSCGNERHNNNQDSNTQSSKIKEVKACDFYSLQEMKSLTGTDFREIMQVLHEYKKDGSLLYTQCSYYTEDMSKTLSVFFRESNIDQNPVSIESYMETSKLGDPEIDSEIDNALKSAVSIKDVGDQAYWYKIMEVSSFVAFWNNRQLNISMIGFEHNAQNLSKARQIAKSLIMKMKN